MNEPEALTVDDVKRRAARRFRIGLGVLAVTFVFCCLPCCGSGAFVVDRGRRIGEFTPPAPVDPESTGDPYWKRLATARRDAMSPRCDDVVPQMLASLVRETPETQAEVKALVQERMAALGTREIFAACSAVYSNQCDAFRFASFRAFVVAQDASTYAAAMRDADTLARILPPAARCDELAAFSEADTSATLPPMPREEVHRTVPRLCARFLCTPADAWPF